MKLSHYKGLGSAAAIPGGGANTSTGRPTTDTGSTTSFGFSDRLKNSSILQSLAANAANIKPLSQSGDLQLQTSTTENKPKEKSFFADDSILKGIPNWGTLAIGGIAITGITILLTTPEEPKKGGKR